MKDPVQIAPGDLHGVGGRGGGRKDRWRRSKRSRSKMSKSQPAFSGGVDEGAPARQLCGSAALSPHPGRTLPPAAPDDSE